MWCPAEEDLAAAKDAMEATLGRFKAGLWSAALAQSWAAREHAADCQALLPSTRWSSAQAAEADLHSSGNGGEPQEQARLGDTMAQWPEVQPCLFPLSKCMRTPARHRHAAFGVAWMRIILCRG